MPWVGGCDKGKRLRNAVLVGSREDKKKQDNFRADGALKTMKSWGGDREHLGD